MPFKVDQWVRIKETAFQGSLDPQDVALRGQAARLTFDLSEAFNSKDWAGCWEAVTSDGQPIQLTESEMEAIEA